MKTTIAVACGLFVLATLTPLSSAKSWRLDAPDPERGVIGVSMSVIQQAIAGGVGVETVYFARVPKGSDTLDAESVVASNYADRNRVYLLNAEPGRYVLIGGKCAFAMPAAWGVVLFSNSDILQTEVEVGAGSVVFIGAIDARVSTKMHELDEAQTHNLSIIMAASPKPGLLGREHSPKFGYPTAIKEIRRGDDVETDFWSGAIHHEFRNEPAWVSRINGRPVLPVAGAAKPVPAPNRED